MIGNKLSSWRIAPVAIVLAAATSATGAVTTVYKCFDRGLGVLYTDQPCRGEQLDIDGGIADPAAVAELQRERDALSRAVAQRLSDNRRTPVEQPAYVVGPPPIGPDFYYPAGLGYYGPYANERARRGNAGAGGDNNARPRMARSVPAVPANGITNRTFR